MSTDPRIQRVATLVAWMQFDDFPRLRALLQKVLEVYVDSHTSFDVTMGDCYAFATYIKVLMARRGFADPSEDAVTRWFQLAKTRESFDAAIACDESGGRDHWIGELRNLNYAMWVSRGMRADDPQARDLALLFRLIWHILAHDRRLLRWYAEGSHVG